MAANTLPSGIGDLFLLADRMRAGLKLHGPWLLKGAMATEEFSEALTNAQDAEAAFLLSRAAKAVAGERFATADTALTTWLAKARLVVMLAYGSQWSESWLATGFTNRGTSVPKRIGPRIELARRLVEFLAGFPEYEVAFAGVTAANARHLHEQIAAREKQMRARTSETSEKKRARDAAEKRLRRQMRCLRLFLSAVLKKNDPRWRAFGLNIPRPNDRATVRTCPASGEEPVKIEFSAAELPSIATAAA